MKLIVGLGNPGKKYVNTRHNLGFHFVDLLKIDLEAGTPRRRSFGSLRGRSPATTATGAIFFKNSSFINEAGKEVKKTISWHKILLEDVLVVHDDFDLELGQFRIQSNRSSAGHKGVQSLIDELGSKDFSRLRVGISPPPSGIEANDYVLECFSPQEQEVLASIFPNILATTKDWLLQK